jgi:hypothetical protein
VPGPKTGSARYFAARSFDFVDQKIRIGPCNCGRAKIRGVFHMDGLALLIQSNLSECHPIWTRRLVRVGSPSRAGANTGALSKLQSRAYWTVSLTGCSMS